MSSSVTATRHKWSSKTKTLSAGLVAGPDDQAAARREESPSQEGTYAESYISSNEFYSLEETHYSNSLLFVMLLFIVLIFVWLALLDMVNCIIILLTGFGSMWTILSYFPDGAP